MKADSSLPHSQQPAICPCPQPDQSTYSEPISVRSVLILFSHLRLCLPSVICLSGFGTSPIRRKVPHAPPISFRAKTRCKHTIFSSGLQYSEERKQPTAFVNTLRETEYQSCSPKFHRLVHTALPVVGMPRLSVTRLNPLAARTCLDGRCWQVLWRHV